MLSRATRRLTLFGLAAFLIFGGAGAGLALQETPYAKTREALLSHTHRFVAGGASVDLSPAQLRPLLQVESDRLAIDNARLNRLLASRFADWPARDAALQIVGTRVVVKRGTAARTLDAPATAAALLGERTLAKGFVPAPTIFGGLLVDSVGGGISQVATTLYNAAFFAGLDLVAHTPHSLYIDRYPMGREATISWGGPELVFRNDWDAAVLLKLVATDMSITVRLYSSELGRRVETTTGTPYRWTPPVIREVADSTLAPGARVVVQEPGGSGFTVDYTRKVFVHDRLVRGERFTTRYDAKDGIVHVGVPVLDQR